MKANLVASTAVLALLMATSQLRAEAENKNHMHDEMFSTGEPGDAKKPARIVRVTMTESNGKMLYSPNRIEVRRDEQIRFVLRNSGELEHEFVLGTTKENLKHAASMKTSPDMEHDDANAMKLSPKKTGEIVWKFSKPGEFEYACLIPGHREAGMIGAVIVK